MFAQYAALQQRALAQADETDDEITDVDEAAGGDGGDGEGGAADRLRTQAPAFVPVDRMRPPGAPGAFQPVSVPAGAGAFSARPPFFNPGHPPAGVVHGAPGAMPGFQAMVATYGPPPPGMGMGMGMGVGMGIGMVPPQPMALGMGPLPPPPLPGTLPPPAVAVMVLPLPPPPPAVLAEKFGFALVALLENPASPGLRRKAAMVDAVQMLKMSRLDTAVVGSCKSASNRVIGQHLNNHRGRGRCDDCACFTYRTGGGHTRRTPACGEARGIKPTTA